jgi:hypothetical protein
MKRFFLIFAAMLWAATAHAADVVLVDFSTNGCTACIEMQPVLAELKADGWDVRRATLEKDPAIVAAWKVTEFPTLIVTEDNQELWRNVGACSKEALLARLQAVSERKVEPLLLSDEEADALKTSACQYDQIVYVRCRGIRGNQVGSGAIVHSDGETTTVLTAAHVVNGFADSKISIVLPSTGREIPIAASQRVYQGRADWAALTLPDVGLRPFKVANTMPATGDKITFHGFAGSIPRYRAATGTVARIDSGGFWVRGTLARMGDSGGPATNDRGEFVGVVSEISGRESTYICGYPATKTAWAGLFERRRGGRPAPAPSPEGSSPDAAPPQIVGDDGELLPIPIPLPGSDSSDSFVLPPAPPIEVEADAQLRLLQGIADKLNESNPQLAGALGDVQAVKAELVATTDSLKALLAGGVEIKTPEDLQAKLAELRDFSDRAGKLADTISEASLLPAEVKDAAGKVSDAQQEIVKSREAVDEAVAQSSKLMNALKLAGFWFGIPVSGSLLLWLLLVTLLLLRRDFRRARQNKDALAMRKLGLKIGGQIGGALVAAADKLEAVDRYGHGKIEQGVEAAKSVVEGAVGRAVDAVKPAKQKPVE